MDALELIKDNMDVLKVLKHYDFDDVAYEGNMVRSACKLHGGDSPSAFVINPESGLWYCHTGGCGGGDVFNLAQDLDGSNFKQSVETIASILGIDIANLEINKAKDADRKELESWIRTMKKWNTKREYEPYKMQEELQTVNKFRDFHESTLNHFNATYSKYYNRLVIPVAMNGVQVGVSMRKVKASDNPKWLHQPRGIKTAELLYNYDSASSETTIVVAEGTFDVWALYEAGINAVATYGAGVTESQYQLLMKTGADIVFAYDGDDAGHKGVSNATSMFRNKANVFSMTFSDGEDPASITREELRERYNERVRIC